MRSSLVMIISSTRKEAQKVEIQKGLCIEGCRRIGGERCWRKTRKRKEEIDGRCQNLQRKKIKKKNGMKDQVYYIFFFFS